MRQELGVLDNAADIGNDTLYLDWICSNTIIAKVQVGQLHCLITGRKSLGKGL